MLRLTFVLCSGLFLALLIGGRDFGQLRPGLAQAEAEAKATPVTAEVPVVETVALVSDAPAAAPVVVAAVVAEPVVDAVPVSAVAQAVPEPVQTEPENNVFTLSSYADPVPESAPIAAEQPAEGEVWYVAGNSLNVRSGPSTDDDVVGKLARGEATLVVWREGEDWARIRIEGDGIEGYVAMRFLSPNVPVVN
jgi:Bacterial SH3 domain